MTDVMILDVSAWQTTELEERMVQARKSSVEFEAIGEHETADLYSVRLDMMLDEWTRRRAA
jgi:hypothetical protein